MNCFAMGCDVRLSYDRALLTCLRSLGSCRHVVAPKTSFKFPVPNPCIKNHSIAVSYIGWNWMARFTNLSDRLIIGYIGESVLCSGCVLLLL